MVGHVDVIFRLFRGHAGIMLGWNRVGIILGSRWDHFGITLGSYWNHVGIFLWDHLGVILGSLWNPAGMDLGSLAPPLGPLDRFRNDKKNNHPEVVQN